VRDGEHLSIDDVELVVNDFGPAECSINEQAAYINAVREMVASAMKEHPELSDASRAAIQQRVRAVYKDWPLEMIIDMNTISLAGEITRS